MEKAKLMQLEIEKKRKLPQNVKDNISTDIFQNLLAAIIIVAYLCAINIIYYKVNSIMFENYMKYFALGIILLTIVVFEVAYRKDSIKYCLIGIELLVCGVLSLYIPYIYLHTTKILRNIIMILPVCLVIYYAIKSLLIFKQKQFKYQNNLSDVKEIVKETEKVSYLDEDSKKLYREKKREEEIIKEQLRNEQKIRKIKKQQKNITKEEKKIKEKRG